MCYQKDWLKVLWSDFKYPQTSGTGGILIWFYWNCADLRKTEPKIKFIFSINPWSLEGGDFYCERGWQENNLSSLLSLCLAVGRSEAGASLEQHSAISCLEQEIWCSFLFRLFLWFFPLVSFPAAFKIWVFLRSYKACEMFSRAVSHSKHLLLKEDGVSRPQVWRRLLWCKILSVI